MKNIWSSNVSTFTDSVEIIKIVLLLLSSVFVIDSEGYLDTISVLIKKW